MGGGGMRGAGGGGGRGVPFPKNRGEGDHMSENSPTGYRLTTGPQVKRTHLDLQKREQGVSAGQNRSSQSPEAHRRTRQCSGSGISPSLEVCSTSKTISAFGVRPG